MDPKDVDRIVERLDSIKLHLYVIILILCAGLGVGISAALSH